MFGFTKGQFSMVDLMEAILDRTGEADVVVSTWTAASRDLQRCLTFLQKDMVRTMLWLVDLSFERRVPEFALQLRDMFGADAVRIIPSHCKFILIKNAEWNVVIQTSMNLNHNPRLENFWICDDREFYEEYYKLVDMIFQIQKPGAGFGRRPRDTMAEFKGMGDTGGIEGLDLMIEIPTGKG
jgi:hypothetical protein